VLPPQLVVAVAAAFALRYRSQKGQRSPTITGKTARVLEAKSQEQDKAAREAEAKADALDAAVFDLKAVNPNAVVRIDARTPEEVILSIGDQVEIAAQALKTLRALLQA
jgi:hypothetical protein